jgi:hypothetical protein
VRGARVNRIALVVLVALIVCYAVFTLAIALLNPPWEAPDEADHVQNVETLVGGHWYRIEPGAGYEPHQPPLYYLVLAGLQELSGQGARVPRRVYASGPYSCIEPDGDAVVRRNETPLRCALWRHDLPEESVNRRLVRLLRVPSVLCGVAVLCLTAATARRISSDAWTPLASAAFVAGVPGYAFTSAIVNNDALATLLATITLLVAVTFVQRSPPIQGISPYAVMFGVLVGLLLLTKLYAPAVVIGVGVSVWLASRKAAERAKLRFRVALIATVAGLVVAGSWFVQNQRWYGDPFALTRSRDYLESIAGLGPPRHYGTLRILLVDARQRFLDTFLYRSFAGHLLWIPLIGSICCLALPGARRNRSQLVVLASFVVAALLALGVVAVQTATFRSSTAYIGLPALAILAALGLERIPAPAAIRLLPPLAMCAVTIAIYRDNLVALYNHS